jgi:hypothetical protein
MADSVLANRVPPSLGSMSTRGVQCGLAVRDRLSAEQAVDFIVISHAAVSVQDDQATRGRISVHFKNVDRWVRRHESI